MIISIFHTLAAPLEPCDLATGEVSCNFQHARNNRYAVSLFYGFGNVTEIKLKVERAKNSENA